MKRFVKLSIPNKEIPIMLEALDRLKGKPGFQMAGEKAISGTNCTITNPKGQNGEHDFECEDA
ncbi:MAG: hypothetical protein AAF633_21180 [Chloroflexota bacterium]